MPVRVINGQRGVNGDSVVKCAVVEVETGNINSSHYPTHSTNPEHVNVHLLMHVPDWAMRRSSVINYPVLTGVHGVNGHHVQCHVVVVNESVPEHVH